jgi:hypothetical protein
MLGKRRKNFKISKKKIQVNKLILLPISEHFYLGHSFFLINDLNKTKYMINRTINYI